MRLISGELKGRQLIATQGVKLRPTSERVREAIFSSLSATTSFENKVILDFFAGSGALGLEALSRGAKGVIFIERNNRLVEVLRKNIKNFHLEERALVINQPVQNSFSAIISKLSTYSSGGVDIVFSDPPYEEDIKDSLSEGLIKKLIEHRLIEDDGIAVFEQSSRAKKLTFPGSKKVAEKMYGDTKLTYFTI